MNNFFKKSRTGFTLIEVLVVITILSVLSTLGYVVTIDFYKSYFFNAERDTIVSLLQKARSESLANICLGSGCTNGQPHGVHFGSGQYVIFQGQSFNPNSFFNRAIPSTPGIANTGIADVIFEQLSGDAKDTGGNPINGDLSLTDGKRMAIISLNPEGQINW